MKKITVALLYNVRHEYPDPKNSRTQLESDFDDAETTKLQIKALKNIGYKVIPIEADEKAYFKLYKNRKKINIVFNLSEGIYGKDREAQLPAILEMLRLPYTGNSPLTAGLILHKARTKEILKMYGVPTLPHQIFKLVSEKLNNKLQFPLIVKPMSEGSSAGITNKSIVRNNKELIGQIKEIIESFHEEALVEPYLEGREFSIGMWGNPPKILPIIEPNHSILPKKYYPIDSVEVKWYFEMEDQNNYLTCPAKVDPVLKNKLEKICYGTWEALNVLDWCRLDIRCDKSENPYVLEVNSPPGCTHPKHDPNSYFPLASRAAGINYEKMLKMIIDTALKRYK